ncbi:MAG: AsmA family protein [Bacteroidales bacterium]|nr:AsmA family protein [Bacteroidales bacterium]
MKKLSRIILLSLGGLILLILVLLFTVPLLFKDKIRAKVEQVINESVNAKVNFDAYKLGFFKDFPNLSFSLDNVSVVGIDKFENDTLAAFKSFNLVFNLGSLFSNAGYEVKSIIVDQALVNAIYLEDGSANWDIAKETEEEPDQEVDSGSSGMKILLKKVSLINSSISYIDKSSDLEAYLNDLNFDLKGDMTMSETDMQIAMNAGDVTFIMEGTKYLNKAVADSKINLLADLDGMKFTLRDNYVEINDLRLNFSGMVAMPGDDIETDLSFGTEQTSFKTLLSLIPAIYMKDFEGLRTSGEFELSGSAKGVYSDADSTMPDIALDLKIKDGLISYPDLPERISNIRLDSRLFADGKDPDMTIVNIDAFHMELAGNPFDMTFALRTPMSDPDFSGSMVGKLDLTALSKAVPLDSISLTGLIDMSVKMAGRLSMIENQQYDKFQASGKMDINNMEVTMTGYPGVKINEAGFEFSPAYAALTKSDLMVGEKSDFSISGRLENYIPYLFKNETLKGKLTVRSKMLDASDILSKIAADTTAIDDTTSLALIRIPDNIDFDFNALINDLKYDKISANDLKGHIIVRDGVLSIRETGMNILGGIVAMNADYDTRDTLKPVLRTDFDIKSFGVKDAFNTFNTIQKLAPAAQGIDGKVNVKLTFESLLGSDWMPVIPSISGSGKLQSDEVTLVTAVAYDQMKKVLKLSDSYSNTFKDINVSFSLKEGRIYVQPFDTRVGNIKMNISGDQGIDQTLNYIVKTEIPRSELGSSLNSAIENLSTQAAAFGFAFKPADVLKVNVRITGVFGRPVVTPVFGSTSGESSSGSQSTIRETAKQVVGDAVDTSKEKLRKEAEARGDELIREAEAKAQLLRDEAAKGAETIRKEADAQAQRLITEASTKGTVAKLAAQRAADTLKKEADKRADQLVSEADTRANQLIEEAKTKKQEMIDRI